MAWQLIYTSARRTLTPGQSGYGTVARSADLREAIIQRLEQLSYYSVPNTATRAAPLPVIQAFRVLNVRGSKYLVLSRIVDARLDFTNRTNHLAHHLVLNPGEVGDFPSPATLLLHWDGWKDLWSEEPRFLDDSDWGNLSGLPRSVPLPAANWGRVTGDAGRAAALVDLTPPGGIQLLVAPDQEPGLLGLFEESLQLLDPQNRSPAQRWQFTFTTLLQGQDDPADFQWRCWPAALGVGRATRRSPAATTFTLTDLPVPDSPHATLARLGPGVSAVRPSPSLASPGQLSPSGASAAPLRLHRSAISPDIAPPSPEPHPRVAAKPSPPRGTILVRLLKGRILIPLIVLVSVGVLLVGGFHRPGWFLERRTSRRPAETALNTILPDTVPDIHPPPAVATAPATIVPPPTSALEDPEESKRILEAAIDRIPTYLVPSQTESDSLELGSIPELEELLRRVFSGAQQLGSEDIRVRVQTGDLRLALDPSMPEGKPGIQEFGGKKFSVNLPGARPLELLDCTEWIRDPRRSIRLSRLRMADRGLALVFQPAAGEPVFAAFRLLFLTGQPPKPIRLPKVLLRPNSTDYSNALDPDLLERLPRFPASPISSLRYQLRTYVGHPPTEVFAPFLKDYQPAEVCELALDVHRGLIEARLKSLNNEWQKYQAEAEKRKVEIETSITNDLPLGVLLGVTKSTNFTHLASLAAFAKSKGNREFPNREDFTEYLRSLFEQLRIQAPPLRGPPGRTTGKELLQLHGLLVNGMKSGPANLDAIPPSYFTNRWSQLGTVEFLREIRNKCQSLSNQVVRLGALRERIPADLDAISRVSLHVVDAKGDRLFELIRFTDLAQDSTP